MKCSYVCRVRWKNAFSLLRLRQTAKNDANVFDITKKRAVEQKMTVSEEAENMLKKMLPSLKSGDEPAKQRYSDGDELLDGVCEQKIDMDSIRARGFLKFRYSYEPPDDLDDQIEKVTNEVRPLGEGEELRKIDLTQDRRLKFQLLDLLGERLCHVVPNCELHRMKTIGDVIDFYGRPFQNLTKYAQMARDNKQTLPTNLHVMEHPVRFHPEDIHAYHGGETAFPGRGGEVYSLRNKRLYKQFKPKENWFDYEDDTFDYSRPDKGMPWDPEIAERMDRYPVKKYNLETKMFRKT